MATQGDDGKAHITYFDVRSQASFVWDGHADGVEISIGGYSEPVALVVLLTDPVASGGLGFPLNGRAFPVGSAVSYFERACAAYAEAKLPEYGVAEDAQGRKAPPLPLSDYDRAGERDQDRFATGEQP